MYKHILIPTDGPPQSQKAIVRGVELAKAIGAKVTGIFAAPPATPIIYREQPAGRLTTMADHEEIIEKAAGVSRRHRAGRRRRPAFHARCTVTSDYPADYHPGDRQRRRNAISS